VGDEVRCTFKQRVEILVDRFLAHLRSDVVVGAGVDWRPAPRVVDCDDRIFLAYSISTSEAPSSAIWRLSAMTRATGSPT